MTLARNDDQEKYQEKRKNNRSVCMLLISVKPGKKKTQLDHEIRKGVATGCRRSRLEGVIATWRRLKAKVKKK